MVSPVYFPFVFFKVKLSYFFPLPGWARPVGIGTKNATITLLGFYHFFALNALIKILASLLGHSGNLSKSAKGTGQFCLIVDGHHPLSFFVSSATLFPRALAMASSSSLGPSLALGPETEEGP